MTIVKVLVTLAKELVTLVKVLVTMGMTIGDSFGSMKDCIQSLSTNGVRIQMRCLLKDGFTVGFDIWVPTTAVGYS